MTIPLLTTGLLVALLRVAPASSRSQATIETGQWPPRHDIPAVEVVVVRIGADGKPLYACVNGAAAAKRFLDAPAERVARSAREK